MGFPKAAGFNGLLLGKEQIMCNASVKSMADHPSLTAPFIRPDLIKPVKAMDPYKPCWPSRPEAAILANSKNR